MCVKSLFMLNAQSTVRIPQPMAAGWELREFLQLLGRAESASEHPLGRAIYSYVQSQIVLAGGCDDYEAVPGMKWGGVMGLRCHCKDLTHLPAFPVFSGC